MNLTSKPITITRRTFVLALAASAALGLAVGEMAAPLESSQANVAAHSAAAPAACQTFEENVGSAFTILGTLLEDASQYPALIPKAYNAGVAHSSSQYAAVGRQLIKINALVEAQDKAFNKLKGPLVSEGKACLS